MNELKLASKTTNICGCHTLKLIGKGHMAKKITYATELCHYHDEYLGNSIEDMQNDPSNYEGIDGCEWADKLAEE